MVNLNLNLNSDYVRILFLNIFPQLNNNQNQINSLNYTIKQDFKNLVLELLNQNNQQEKTNIIEKLVNNQKLSNALYKAVAAFILTDEIKNIPFISEKSIGNNYIINEIALSENLNSEEKSLLTKAIKYVIVEIVSSQDRTQQFQNLIVDKKLIPTTSNPVSENNFKSDSQIKTDNNFSKQDDILINNQNNNIADKIKNTLLENNNMVLSQNINNFAKNGYSKNNNELNLLSTNIVMDKNDTQQQIVLNKNINLIVSDTKAKIININLNPDEIALNKNNNILNNDVEIPKNNNLNTKNNYAVNDRINNLLKNFENILLNIKNNLLNLNNKIDKNIKDENILKILKNQIDEIIKTLSNIKVANKETPEIKENIAVIIRETINILPLINQVISKNFSIGIANLEQNNNSNNNLNLITVNLDSQIINNSLHNQKNNSEFLLNTNKKFYDIKDSVFKIFALLKELNGEMQIFRKIEYVYQPNTTKTSIVTPDGILFINLSPLDKITNSELKFITKEIIPLNKQVNLNSMGNNIINENQSNPIINSEIANNKFNNNELILNRKNNDLNNYIKTYQPEVKDILKNEMITKNNKEISWILDNISKKIDNNQFTNKIDIFKDIIDVGNKIKQEIVLSQIKEKIVESISISEKFHIRINLKPENLGPVFIKIENKEKQISINIQVANNEVRDILKINLAEIKNSLNNLGYDVKNFEITLMNQNTNNFNNNSNSFYKEWESAVLINNTKEVVIDSDIIYDNFSYLNYLA